MSITKTDINESASGNKPDEEIKTVYGQPVLQVIDGVFSSHSQSQQSSKNPGSKGNKRIMLIWCQRLLRIKYYLQHLVYLVIHAIFPHVFLTLIFISLFRHQDELPHLMWLYGFTACFVTFFISLYLQEFMPGIIKTFISKIHDGTKYLVYVFLLATLFSFEHGYRGVFPNLERMTVIALIICGLCSGHHIRMTIQRLIQENQS